MYKMTKIKKDTKQISSNVKLLLEAAWRWGGGRGVFVGYICI